MRLERGDDRLGMDHLVLRRRKRGVDDGDLRGVNRELAGEAFSPRRFRFSLEALVVLEIGKDSVDRLDACGHGPRKAKASGEFVCEAELAALVILRRSSERGRQILRAPAHRSEW